MESCLSGNDDTCGLQSEVTFCAVQGQTYHIFIGGYQGATGDYVISVMEDAPACTVASSLCTYISGTLDIGSDVTGDTGTEDLPPESLSCGGDLAASLKFHLHDLEAPVQENALMGLWTCDSEDFDDTILAVYEYEHAEEADGGESCPPFQCVASNDDSPYCQFREVDVNEPTLNDVAYTDYYVPVELDDEVSTLWSFAYFCFEPQRRYAAQIGGYRDNTGVYRLSYDQIGRCTSGLVSGRCVDATPALVDDTVQAMKGSTLDVVDGASHTWFRVEGDGAVVQVSSCNSAFKSRVSLYAGCEEGAAPLLDPESCRMNFCSLPGETYYVRLTGQGVQRGNFDVLLWRSEQDCLVPPYAPRPRVTAVTASSVTVRWADATQNLIPVEHYEVEVLEADGAARAVASATVSGALSVELDGLIGGTEYVVRARARNAFGESDVSQLVPFRTDADGECVFRSVADEALAAEPETYATYLRGIHMHVHERIHVSGVTFPAVVTAPVDIDVRVYASSAARPQYFRKVHEAQVAAHAAEYAQLLFAPLDTVLCPTYSYVVVVSTALYSTRLQLFRDVHSNSSTCSHVVASVEGVTFRGSSWRTFEEEVALRDDVLDATVAMSLQYETLEPLVRIDAPAAQRVLPFYDSVVVEWGTDPCVPGGGSLAQLEVQVVAQSGAVVAEQSSAPGELRSSLFGLAANTDYVVRLTALSSSGDRSEPLEVPFTTTGNSPSPVWSWHSTLPEFVSYGLVESTSVCASLGSVPEEDLYVSAGWFTHGVRLAGTDDEYVSRVPWTYDTFLSAWSGAGELVWSRHLGNTGEDVQVFATAADADRGAVYVGGRMEGRFEVDGEQFESPLAADTDAIEDYTTVGFNFVLKLSSVDGSVQWLRTAGSLNGTSYWSSLVVELVTDADGAVYSSGLWEAPEGSCFAFDHSDQCVRSVSPFYGAYVAKYSTDGELLWVRTYHGDSVRATWGGLALTGDGAVAFSAVFSNLRDADGSVVSEGRGWLVAAIDATTGDERWMHVGRRGELSDSSVTLRAAPTDATLFVAVSSECGGTSLGAFEADDVCERATGRTMLLAALDAGSGGVQWHYRMVPEEGELTLTLRSMEWFDGALVLSGSYSGSFPLFTFPRDDLVGFVAAFSPEDGAPLWGRYVSSSRSAYVDDVAAGRDELVMVGRFTGITSFSCTQSFIASSEQTFIVALGYSGASPQDSLSGTLQGCVSLEEALASPLTTLTGMLSFPLDGETYPPNADCWWYVAPSEAAIWRVSLLFDSFVLGDASDYVEIFDGADPTADGALLRYWNGNGALKVGTRGRWSSYDFYEEEMVFSSDTRVLVHFHSSPCIPGSGVRLEWLSSDRGAHCLNDFPTVLHGRSGAFAELPLEGYKPHARCQWSIEPAFEDVAVVVLRMEQWEVAANDRVIVYDGDSPAAPVLAEVTGADARRVIQSTTPLMFVEFVSDGSGFGAGFTFSYQSYAAPLYCAGEQLLRATESPVTEIASDRAEGLPMLPGAVCGWVAENDDPATYDAIYVAVSDADLPYRSSLHVEYVPSPAAEEPVSVSFLSADDGVVVGFGSVANVSLVDDGSYAYRDQGFNGSVCFHPRAFECGGVFTAHHGSFNNSFCGGFYANDADCRWAVEAAVQNDDAYVLLVFTQLDMQNAAPEFPDDVVTVEAADGSPLATFSHSVGEDETETLPAVAVASSTAAVRFVSDDALVGRGFQVDYCVHNGSYCGAPLELSGEGSFDNHFCSGFYGANAHCQWVFRGASSDASSAATVILRFDGLEFPAEQQARLDGQMPDRLEVEADGAYFGAFDQRGFQATQFSPSLAYSRQSFAAALSGVGEVRLHFLSDAALFAPAFNASYCVLEQDDPRLCSGVRSVQEPGNFTNTACLASYQPNADCTWEVDVSAHMSASSVTHLFLSSMQIGEGDALVVTTSAGVTSFEGPLSTSTVETITLPAGRGSVHFTSDEVFQGRGFDADVCVLPLPLESCGGDRTLRELSGVVADRPCGAAHFVPLRCSWRVEPDPALIQPPYFIIVTLERLALNAGTTWTLRNDTSVFAERSDDYSSLAIDEGESLVLRSDALVVDFEASEEVVPGGGFVLSYLVSQLSGLCSEHELEVRSESSGVLRDHVHGRTYSNDMECSFLVEVAAGETVKARFTRFDLEKGYDFLTVYDGADSSAPLIGRYSGAELPPVILTSSNQLFLSFTTDYSVVREGFVLEYDTDPLCPLFCSGNGVCDELTGTCACDPLFRGDGCHIPPPPFVRLLVPSPSLGSLLATFSLPTNRAGMYRSLVGDTFTSCEHVLAAETLDNGALGDGPACTWLSDEQLEITMGADATVLPGDLVHLRGGVLQERAASAEYPFAAGGAVPVAAPADVVQPRGQLTGPVVFGDLELMADEGLVVDAWGSEHSGGRTLLYEWDVQVFGSCRGDRAMEALLACDPADRELLDVSEYAALAAFVAAETGVFVRIPVSLLTFPDHCYVTRTRVTNYLESRSTWAELVSFHSSVPRPHVSVGGPQFREASPAGPISLRSQVQLPESIASDQCLAVEYVWSVEAVSGLALAAPLVELDAVSRVTRDLFVPAGALQPQSLYRFRVEVHVQSLPSSVAMVAVRTLPQQLHVSIAEGNRFFADTERITLTAVLADAEQLAALDGQLSFHWLCVHEATEQVCSRAHHDAIVNNDSPVLDLPPGALFPGLFYTFSLRVSHSSPAVVDGDTSVLVSVSRRNQLPVAILPLPRGGVVNAHERVRLESVAGVAAAAIHNDAGERRRDVQRHAHTYSYRWSVVQGDVDLDLPERLLSSSRHQRVLVLAPGALVPGSLYHLRVVVNSSNGLEGAAEVRFVVNDAPVARQVSVSPATGDVTTPFRVSVREPSDSPGDYPLLFQFFHRPENCSAALRVAAAPGELVCAEVPLTTQLTDPTYDVFLPAGTHTIVAFVYDRYGARFRAHSQLVEVSDRDACSSVQAALREVEGVLAQVERRLCLGDLEEVRQLTNVVSALLACDFPLVESQQSVAAFKNESERIRDELTYILSIVDLSTPANALALEMSVASAFVQTVAPSQLTQPARDAIRLRLAAQVQLGTQVGLERQAPLSWLTSFDSVLPSPEDLEAWRAAHQALVEAGDADALEQFTNAVTAQGQGALHNLALALVFGATATCDGTKPAAAGSPNIAVLANLNTGEELRGASIRTTTASFALPDSEALPALSCLGYFASDVASSPFFLDSSARSQDAAQRLAGNGDFGSAVASLTLFADDHQEIPFTTRGMDSDGVRILLRRTRGGDAKCVFYNETTMQWSGDGCEYVGRDGDYFVCECDHLTSFAVLLSGNNDDGDDTDLWLIILSSVFVGVAIVAVIAAVLLTHRKQQRRWVRGEIGLMEMTGFKKEADSARRLSEICRTVDTYNDSHDANITV